VPGDVDGPAQAFDRYRKLINSHDFSLLEEYVVDESITCVFGPRLHRGLSAVRTEFERAWLDLPDEHYEMSDPEWLITSSDTAVALFDYSYEGNDQQGKRVVGKGRGTNVYRLTSHGWRLAHEHLSPDVS
jgi:ketosteroid isomerase-like protein